MQKITLKHFFQHTKLVIKHKWLVFKFCCKLGMPIRGFFHDFSKFSPTEFWESVRYYDGKISPIIKCKRETGYSKAWLHHKGRNMHHDSWWLDLDSPEVAPVIPYKYAAEMLCDKMSASITYNGKNWTTSSEWEYWQKEKTRIIMNPKCQNFFDAVFLEVKENGIDKTYTKKNIKRLYKKYCIDDKTKYKYEFHGEWKSLE